MKDFVDKYLEPMDGPISTGSFRLREDCSRNPNHFGASALKLEWECVESSGFHCHHDFFNVHGVSNHPSGQSSLRVREPFKWVFPKQRRPSSRQDRLFICQLRWFLNNNNTFTWSVPNWEFGITGQRRVAPAVGGLHDVKSNRPLVPLNPLIWYMARKPRGEKDYDSGFGRATIRRTHTLLP
jgi:hypothetical protein